MKRAVLIVMVVLSLTVATGCTKNNKANYCKNHPNAAKCRQ